MLGTDPTDTAADCYGQHTCAIYGSDSELRSQLIRFVDCGIRRGDRVIVVIPRANHKLITDSLSTSYSALREGQLKLLTPEETYFSSGVFAPKSMISIVLSALEESLSEGFSGLSAAGDLSCFAGVDITAGQLKAYEANLDCAISSLKCSVLCLYDSRNLPVALIMEAIETHPFILIGDKQQENIFYMPEHLSSGNAWRAALVDKWLAVLRRQQEADERVATAQHRLEELLERVSDGFIALDSEWRFVYVSQRAQEIVRRAASDMMGKRLLEVFPELAGRALYRKALEAVRQQKPATTEYFSKPLNSWFDMRLYPSNTGLSVYFHDITAEKSSRAIEMELVKQIEAQQRVFAAVFENAPVGIVICDAEDFRVTWANPAYISLLDQQYSSTGILGLILPDILPNAAEMGVVKSLLQVVETGKATFIDEFEYRGLARGLFYERLSIVPLKGDCGKVESLAVLVLDITPQVKARRRIEELASQMETGLRQLEAIVDNMNDGLVVCDSSGLIINVNPAARALLGYSPKEKIGSIEDLRNGVVLRTILNNGESLKDGEWPMDRALAGETFNNLEVELEKANGQKLVMSYTGAPIESRDGKVTAGIITLRDVTPQKRLESDQAFLADAGAALGSSLDFHQTLQNLAKLVVPYLADCCQVGIWTGETIQQEALAAIDEATEKAGRRLQAMYAGRPRDIQRLIAGLQSGRPFLAETVDAASISAMAPREADVEILKSMGLKSLAVVPLNAGEKLLGIMTLGITTSNRRYSQRDLTVAMELANRAAVAVENAILYRTAQEAIGARDEFISVASHELKTPITSLRGFAEMAMKQYEKEGVARPERMYRSLQVIDHQAIKLTHLVLQLLDISRLDRDMLILDKHETDVSSLLHEAVETAQRLSERHRVVSQIKPGIVAEIDALRIEQVLTNLLDNAIRYSPGGGEIEVALFKPNSDSFRITVRDHGIGITPQHRERVFERFYQGHQAARHYGGLGLGLYISSQIVSLHGGSLEADYPEDGGTEFVVTIPLGAPADEGREQPTRH